MNPGIEALWLQIHLPHINPIPGGSCYRPPHSNAQHTEDTCTVLQKATDDGQEKDFWGDFNIRRFSSSSSLKKELQVVMNVRRLNQMMREPTRMSLNTCGVLSVTCIDHLYTNSSELCCKAASFPGGFSG